MRQNWHERPCTRSSIKYITMSILLQMYNFVHTWFRRSGKRSLFFHAWTLCHPASSSLPYLLDRDETNSSMDGSFGFWGVLAGWDKPVITVSGFRNYWPACLLRRDESKTAYAPQRREHAAAAAAAAAIDSRFWERFPMPPEMHFSKLFFPAIF